MIAVIHRSYWCHCSVQEKREILYLFYPYAPVYRGKGVERTCTADENSVEARQHIASSEEPCRDGRVADHLNLQNLTKTLQACLTMAMGICMGNALQHTDELCQNGRGRLKPGEVWKCSGKLKTSLLWASIM